jgi:hypothetical protein
MFVLLLNLVQRLLSKSSTPSDIQPPNDGISEKAQSHFPRQLVLQSRRIVEFGHGYY